MRKVSVASQEYRKKDPCTVFLFISDMLNLAKFWLNCFLIDHPLLGLVGYILKFKKEKRKKKKNTCYWSLSVG
jgi:hypothetical protein